MDDIHPEPEDAAVRNYLGALADPARRDDCQALIKLMSEVTSFPPRMWGTIVGFGDLHYRYESGREGDTFLLGFASRKTDLTLYLGSAEIPGMPIPAALGKHRLGKGCVYIRKLADVNLLMLREILVAAATYIARNGAVATADH